MEHTSDDPDLESRRKAAIDDKNYNDAVTGSHPGDHPSSRLASTSKPRRDDK